MNLLKWICLAFVATLAWPAIAFAGEATAANQAQAESLFDEAKLLMQAEKYEAACPKFAESQRLDAGFGTLMYLGTCYEKIGKYASAWATFRLAVASAQAAAQPERQKLAETKANSVEPLVPKLTIEVNSSTPALEVYQDGAMLSHAAWGSALPLDPGPHKVEARAPGFANYAEEFEVAKSEKRTVRIPTLSAAKPDPAATTKPGEPAGSAGPGHAAGSGSGAPLTGPPTPPSSPLRTAGVVLASVGAAGLVAGTVTGILAFDYAGTAKTECKPGCPTPEPSSIGKSRSFGNISTIAFIAGAAGLSSGLLLYVLGASGPPQPNAKARTDVVVGAGSLWLKGSF